VIPFKQEINKYLALRVLLVITLKQLYSLVIGHTESTNTVFTVVALSTLEKQIKWFCQQLRFNTKQTIILSIALHCYK